MESPCRDDWYIYGTSLQLLVLQNSSKRTDQGKNGSNKAMEMSNAYTALVTPPRFVDYSFVEVKDKLLLYTIFTQLLAVFANFANNNYNKEPWTLKLIVINALKCRTLATKMCIHACIHLSINKKINLNISNSNLMNLSAIWEIIARAALFWRMSNCTRRSQVQFILQKSKASAIISRIAW